MRRRPADYRRLARRRLPSWIWLLLGSFSVAGLVLFIVQHNHHQQDPSQLLVVCLSLIPSLFLGLYSISNLGLIAEI